MIAAKQDRQPRNMFSFAEVSTPQVFLDIDREKAELMGLSSGSVFEALEIYLGSAVINEINYRGRTFRVMAQADASCRRDVDDISLYYARNDRLEMEPVEAVAKARLAAGLSRVPRFNLYPAAELQGEAAPGVSSSQAIARMEALSEDLLPQGFSFERTELAYRQ